MLLVDDLAAGGTKNLRHTPRGLVTLYMRAFYGPPTKRYLMAFRWRADDSPTLNAGLVAL